MKKEMVKTETKLKGVTLKSSICQWTNLVALAVVLQAAWTFAVAAFAVPTVWFSFFAFTNFRFEGFWVSVQTSLQKHFGLNYRSDKNKSVWFQIPQTEAPTHLDGFETFCFMYQIIEAVVTVTVITELSVCKAVTVSERGTSTT